MKFNLHPSKKLFYFYFWSQLHQERLMKPYQYQRVNLKRNNPFFNIISGSLGALTQVKSSSKALKNITFPKKKIQVFLRKPNCEKIVLVNFCMKSQIEWTMGNSSYISPCDMKMQKKLN